MKSPRLFFIPGAVPSSKNSRILTRKGLFIGSKATQKYRKSSAAYWTKFKEEFKSLLEGQSKPIIIGMHFVRGSRHKWDFINPAQTIQDEMTKAGWIDDDNVDEILPVPLEIDGSYWSYDKTNSGVYIAVLSSFCEGYINPKPYESDQHT
jgi:Holliday junction resolvase RusA-like endonuclease